MARDATKQIEKFKRAARELGADESDEVALDKALRKMKRQPEKSEKPKIERDES